MSSLQYKKSSGTGSLRYLCIRQPHHSATLTVMLEIHFLPSSTRAGQSHLLMRLGDLLSDCYEYTAEIYLKKQILSEIIFDYVRNEGELVIGIDGATNLLAKWALNVILYIPQPFFIRYPNADLKRKTTYNVGQKD